MENLYQITFFVPELQCEEVKQAMFNAGAGVLGNYQECSWQTLGQGQFKPLKGCKPFIGEENKLETVAEFRVEMICQKKFLKAVIQALKSSHPYEMPAFNVIKLETTTF